MLCLDLGRDGRVCPSGDRAPRTRHRAVTVPHDADHASNCVLLVLTAPCAHSASVVRKAELPSSARPERRLPALSLFPSTTPAQAASRAAFSKVSSGASPMSARMARALGHATRGADSSRSSCRFHGFSPLSTCQSMSARRCPSLSMSSRCLATRHSVSRVSSAARRSSFGRTCQVNLSKCLQ